MMKTGIMTSGSKEFCLQTLPVLSDKLSISSLDSSDTSHTQSTEPETESDLNSYCSVNIENTFPTSYIYIKGFENTRCNKYKSADTTADLFLSLIPAEIASLQALQASLTVLCDKLDETMEPFSLQDDLLCSRPVSISTDLEKSPLLRRRRATISSSGCLRAYSGILSK